MAHSSLDKYHVTVEQYHGYTRYLGKKASVYTLLFGKGMLVESYFPGTTMHIGDYPTGTVLEVVGRFYHQPTVYFEVLCYQLAPKTFLQIG